MGNMDALLTQRLQKSGQSSKMAAMAKQSTEGNRGSFAGIFSLSELNDQEKNHLEAILNEYSTGEQIVDEDLKSLISITSEVKGINNQAALLHGERIKKAQSILIQYKEGAFTSWLLAAYGNRQTPYNFLQYYEFYEALPKLLKSRVDTMPRQAIYTLASRNGSLEQKLEIVENYQGETKTELLRMIREKFPLQATDKRRQDQGQQIIHLLTRATVLLNSRSLKLSKSQRALIDQLLDNMKL